MSPQGTAEEYRYFASAMARGSSPLYERLALGGAGDEELIGPLDGLPAAKRQVVALDGRPLAWTAIHGGWLRTLA